MQEMEKQIEMINSRLDNMDSVVTALVERIMKQPITIELICPKCDTTIQIMLTSSVKTRGKG